MIVCCTCQRWCWDRGGAIVAWWVHYDGTWHCPVCRRPFEPVQRETEDTSPL